MQTQKMARISDQEVMQYMKEMLSLTITRDDLNNPTKEFVLRLYGEVLNAFGWTRLNQPDLMATNGISDIEALGPMIPCVNTFKVLQKLLPKLHREIDIKLMDILMPEKARTSRIIRELMRMHYKLSDYMVGFVLTICFNFLTSFLSSETGQVVGDQREVCQLGPTPCDGRQEDNAVEAFDRGGYHAPLHPEE